MITAVDSNILIDVFGADPHFGKSSAEALRKSMKEGQICACSLVWIETATVFKNQDSFLEAMNVLGVEFSPIDLSVALKASETWCQYRLSGGKRERVVADFLIGAHAAMQADRLLTRDRGFFRSYFKSLSVVEPSAI